MDSDDRIAQLERGYDVLRDALHKAEQERDEAVASWKGSDSKRLHWRKMYEEACDHQEALRAICEERFQSMTEQYKRADAEHAARAAAEATVQRLHEACVTYMRLSLLARGYWDDDKDMRVGKLLIAMSGLLPGYRADLDQIHLLLRQVGNGIVDAAIDAALRPPAAAGGGEETKR